MVVSVVQLGVLQLSRGCDHPAISTEVMDVFWPATFSPRYLPQVEDIIGLSQLGMGIAVSNDNTLYLFAMLRCSYICIHASNIVVLVVMFIVS